MAMPAADIEAYFAKVETGVYSGLLRLELNLLDRTAAESLTAEFSFHPLVRVLEGLVLDDPDTSNHHVLLRRHPFEGHVLYLVHDDASRIVFSSLAGLIESADRAKAGGLALPDLHPRVSPLALDQGAVSGLVHRLVEGSEEELDVALALIPSMDLSDMDLLAKLAAHPDFFVAEAVADQIAGRPSSALRQVALLCSKHPHFQAAAAGERALRAIDE